MPPTTKPVGRRAVVDGGVVGVEQADRLLADAAEQRLELERLVERLRRARERELAGHVGVVRPGRCGGEPSAAAAALTNTSPSCVVAAEARAGARAREHQHVVADRDQLARAWLRLRGERGRERGGLIARRARRARRARGDEVLQRGQVGDVVGLGGRARRRPVAATTRTTRSASVSSSSSADGTPKNRAASGRPRPRARPRRRADPPAGASRRDTASTASEGLQSLGSTWSPCVLFSTLGGKPLHWSARRVRKVPVPGEVAEWLKALAC